MKQSAVVFTLFVVVLHLGGCGNADRETRASESTFLADFSLGPILEDNEQYLIARHTISGGTVSEPPIPFFQKDETAIVEVEATKISAFMAAVRADIEQSLTRYGAQIQGRGQGGNDSQGPEGKLPNIDYFSFRYGQGEMEGAVNVWGVSGQETNYTLIVLITESRGE